MSSTRPRISSVIAVVAVLLGAAVTPAAANTPNLTWDGPGWGWREEPDGILYASRHGWHLVPAHAPWGTAQRPEPLGFVEAHGHLGGGRGVLGYPVAPLVEQERLWGGAGDVVLPHAYQVFERGVIYSAAGRVATVRGGNSPFDAVHRAGGGGTGRLGYPSADEVREGAQHWYQQFEQGVIYVGPGGAYAVSSMLWSGHRDRGGGGGQLGYPVGNPEVDGQTETQRFERGTLRCTWVPSGSSHPVLGQSGTSSCRTI